jgi:hypothetical protein
MLSSDVPSCSLAPRFYFYTSCYVSSPLDPAYLYMRMCECTDGRKWIYSRLRSTVKSLDIIKALSPVIHNTPFSSESASMFLEVSNTRRVCVSVWERERERKGRKIKICVCKRENSIWINSHVPASSSSTLWFMPTDTSINFTRKVQAKHLPSINNERENTCVSRCSEQSRALWLFN